MTLAIALTARERPPTTFVFEQEEILLGRSTESHIIFDPELDSGVSRVHARIVQLEQGRYLLEDLGSTQGTYVGGAPVRVPVVLRSHDVITLGVDGPRLSVIWEARRGDTSVSQALLRQWHSAFFPLALYSDFPWRFQVYQRVGEGGYGQVWRARGRDSMKWMAVKILKPELLAYGDEKDTSRLERLAERFRREAELVQRLADAGTPGLVTVHETSGDSRFGFLYMLMDYIDGASLDVYSSPRRRLSVARICDVMRQVALTLSHAHALSWEDPDTRQVQHGIVHRDVKPSNILLRDVDNHAFLCDFGIAVVQNANERLTLPQFRVVTSRFTAPEVLATNEITPMTDLWGLAVTTYVLLAAGTFPFEGTTLKDVVESIRRQEVPSLTTLYPDVPSELDKLVRQGLLLNPKGRPADANEWAERLAPFCLL
jgi:serine/threonine protein kinase